MTVIVYPSLILVSDIINGQYIAEKYIFYTRKQAERMFREKYKQDYKIERLLKNHKTHGTLH